MCWISSDNMDFSFRSFSSASAKVAMMNKQGKEDEENTTEVVRPPASIPSPILNLGPDSDLFIGSVPDGKKVPSVIKSRTFKGCMEDLVYGNQLMGLWNWKVHYLLLL